MDGIGARYPSVQSKREKISQIALICAFKGVEDKCSEESKVLGFRQEAGKLLATSLFATGAACLAGLTPHSHSELGIQEHTRADDCRADATAVAQSITYQ